MRMMIARYAALAAFGVVALLGITTNSFAQTAEETVAYLLHGIEDGAASPSMASNPLAQMSWSKVSSVPLVYRGAEGNIGTAELSVELIGQCAYRSRLSFVYGDPGFVTEFGWM